MTTVGDLIDTTIRQHLEMTGPLGVNRLEASMTATQETVELDWQPDPEPAPGHYIEIGNEAMLVLATNGVNLEVLRGQWGSTARAHSATDLVTIQPRFLRRQVLVEVQDEIRSWPTTLYGVSRTDISWASSAHDVDLDGATGKEVTKLLDVRLKPTGDEPWFDLSTAVEVFPVDTDDFSSGWRLHALRGFSASTVQITYAHEFYLDDLDEDIDLEEDVGLSASMLDIVRYGVGGRLLTSQEGERARLDQQGQRRFAEEVPPQHQLTAAEAMMKLRDKRLQDEEERLISRWGTV